MGNTLAAHETFNPNQTLFGGIGTPTSATVLPSIAPRSFEFSAGLTADLEGAAIEAARVDAVDAHREQPFAPLLLRVEALASSRIGNVRSSAREIYEAEVAGIAASAGREVADLAGQIEQAARADTGASISALLGGVRDEAQLKDLEAFLSRRDLPVLAHAALAHAQWETSAGSNGRALAHHVLSRRGLMRDTTLPLSTGLLSDGAGYAGALAAYWTGDPEPVVALFARACTDAASRATRFAACLSDLGTQWSSLLSARRDALAWRVLPLLLRQPVLTSAMVANELGSTQVSARSTLERLEGDSIVVPAQLDKRTRVWRSPEVLELIDAAAAGARLPG